MPRMGKTEEDWNGLKLGSLKTVQPNNFSKLIPAACNFKNNTRETFVCLGSLILSFTCNFFAYFKFHSDWGRVIGKIKQNELDCRDTAPLTCPDSTGNKKQQLITTWLQISSKSHTAKITECWFFPYNGLHPQILRTKYRTIAPCTSTAKEKVTKDSFEKEFAIPQHFVHRLLS